MLFEFKIQIRETESGNRLENLDFIELRIKKLKEN